MPSTPNNVASAGRWLTPRICVLAITALVVGVAFSMARAPRKRLAAAIGESIARRSESEAIDAITRLAAFNEDAITWYVAALADPRESVSKAAAAQLEIQLERWRTLDAIAFEQRWRTLIIEIDRHRSAYTPQAWRRVESLVRKSLEVPSVAHLSGKAQPWKIQIMGLAESLLREARLHPVSHRNESTVAAAPFEPPSGDQAALVAISQEPRRPVPSVATNSAAPPPAYTARLERRIPAVLTQTDDVAPVVTPSRRHPDRVIGESLEVTGWSELELIQGLQTADVTLLNSVVEELIRRGYHDSHLEAARRLFDPDPRVRRKLIDELPELVGINPKVWLEELSQDDNDAVRTAAIAMLRTGRHATRTSRPIRASR